jgi:hypothetical protein
MPLFDPTGDCSEHRGDKGKIMKWIGMGGWVVLCGLLVGGCATAPDQKQIAAADYGRFMAPDECLKLAHELIAGKLKDPSSAQFRNDVPCYAGYTRNVPLLGKSAQFGYRQDGEVNGKNGFGGYVGFRPYHVLMRNGVVVQSCISDENGVCL